MLTLPYPIRHYKAYPSIRQAVSRHYLSLYDILVYTSGNAKPGGASVEGERLLTVQEVSDRLRVHPDTLRRWLRSGRIKGVLMGGRSGGYRIKESEVARVETEGPGEDQASKRAA